MESLHGSYPLNSEIEPLKDPLKGSPLKEPPRTPFGDPLKGPNPSKTPLSLRRAPEAILGRNSGSAPQRPQHRRVRRVCRGL